MLLPNVLAKNAAREAGAGEAILHRGPTVTEGTAANVFIVRKGEAWTHPADQWILPGVTRGLVLEVARANGVALREQAFTVDDLRTADEAFLTGSTTQITAITALDGRPVGAGQIGPVTQRLHALLLRRIAQECAL
jgi:D-alanine transaminase